MLKSVLWALAVGLSIGRIFYRFHLGPFWKVVLTSLVSGIGCLFIFTFSAQYFECGIFLLVLGPFALLLSAKEFVEATSWRHCACFVVYIVVLSFADQVREFIVRLGWDGHRKLFVLPCLGYVIGGGVVALRPLGWGRITGLCGIIIMFLNIEVIKSGFAFVPVIIGSFVFFLSMAGWNLASEIISPRAAAVVYMLSTLMMLILFFL